MSDLLIPTDFAQGRTQLPMRFEREVVLEERIFVYKLALELPKGFRELRVLEERLLIDGELVFHREPAEVKARQKAHGREVVFPIDWHMIALPMIQGSSRASNDPSLIAWMASMVLLPPIPQEMAGEALGADVAIREKATNFADWLAELLERYPAAYTTLIGYLQQVMPDFASLRFEKLGRDSRTLLVQFTQDQSSLELPISALSDGEKCFVLNAVLLAANQHAGPIFAFWDEPDSHLTVHEVNLFITALKRSFLRKKGQIIMTSHNPQTIMCFSDVSTWVMGRRSHLEPSIVRSLDELLPVAARNTETPAPSLMQRLLDGEA